MVLFVVVQVFCMFLSVLFKLCFGRNNVKTTLPKMGVSGASRRNPKHGTG